MKKLLLVSALICSLIFIQWKTNNLSAQKITVPDYTFGNIYSEQGRVTPDGVAMPGPSGGYSTQESARPFGVTFAHGYRWWNYPSLNEDICGGLPRFNYPGSHGYLIAPGTVVCSDLGYMGSWGGVIADPANRGIWCLHGAHHNYGPTATYCINNPYGSGQICWPIPTTWGSGTTYGYLRKVVVVKSAGSLQIGNPVNIKAVITSKGTYDGNGTSSSKGVLFLNKISEALWAKSKDYLNWPDVQDILGMPPVINSMRASLQVDLNHSDDSTVILAVGDTIVLELMFNNSIKLANTFNADDAEGWIGKKPPNLHTDPVYARKDSIIKYIRKYGNNLSYELTCLTSGAVLEPVTAGGPNLDEDRDGISDANEKGANGNDNSFDGNGDGIPDYKQGNVASFHTYDWQNYVTLEVPAGTELSQLKVTGNPSFMNAPADAEFPWGFFDFTIDGLDQGEAIIVRLTLHESDPVGKYYKYSMTPDNMTLHWYDFTYNGQTGAEINGNVVTLHFVDGLRGDDDITANGTIKEPGGPAKSGATVVSELTDESGFSVYPNPAGSFITLKVNDIPAGNYVVSINSITGRRVLEKVAEVCDIGQLLVIPADRLPGGIYIVTLRGFNTLFKSKFIIK